VLNAISRGETAPWPQLLRELHSLLGDRPLRVLALWRIGITSDWLDAADSAARAARPLAPHEHTLGGQALAQGNYAEAARRFESFRSASPDPAGTLLLEAYALCRGGDLGAASAALARGTGFSRDAAFDESVAWLERTFGLEVQAAP